MLLSVVVYNHTLTFGQWLGAAIVFAGISVEAFVKRKGRALDSVFEVLKFICTLARRPRKTSYTREREGKDQVFVV